MNPQDYLGSCDIIDVEHPEVQRMARELAGESELETSKRCFEFVRDLILHSSDHQMNPVTCRASDALQHRTGYCYAKSHLLAALLRANQIPAGLCYQRLSISGDGAPFCLHGLNAVFLTEFGWYRVDPRGNREGIHAEFCPPTEKLAFTTNADGESDLDGIHVQPVTSVVECLGSHCTWDAVYRNLPDVS